MQRRTVVTTSIATLLATTLNRSAFAQSADERSQASLDTAMAFMGAMGQGDTVAVLGKMNGRTTVSGKETGEFTFALRVKVADGKVKLWHWFEDSYAVSVAYHG